MLEMEKNNFCAKCGAALMSGKCPKCEPGDAWDHTLTCRSCGMKKYIGINEGDKDCGDRMNLIVFEQDRARCCNKPDLYMFPPKIELTPLFPCGLPDIDGNHRYSIEQKDKVMRICSFLAGTKLCTESINSCCEYQSKKWQAVENNQKHRRVV